MLERVERVVELARAADVETGSCTLQHLVEAPREPTIALRRFFTRARRLPRRDDAADERARGARQRAVLVEARDLLVGEAHEKLPLARDEGASRRGDHSRLHRRQASGARLEGERVDRAVHDGERRILGEHRAHRHAPKVGLGRLDTCAHRKAAIERGEVAKGFVLDAHKGVDIARRLDRSGGVRLDGGRTSYEQHREQCLLHQKPRILTMSRLSRWPSNSA